MGNKKREMFVFIGQNASSGTPHQTTGHMSFYGSVYRVDGTLRQAREFADMKYYAGGNNMCIPGGRRKMRKYCLGMSMRVFDEYLDEAVTVYPDVEEDARLWLVS